VPGIVCVLGGTDPAARARLGAGPLARRARHRLHLEDASGDGVALAFCGETGGTARDATAGAIAALDGELLSDDGVVAAREGARVLLERYLAGGESLDLPEGWYAGVVWDPQRRELVLVTDHFGQRPLYVARIGGALVVASELKALVAAGLRPELDLQGWAEMLAFEYPLADSTPLAGVESVPQASVLVFSSDGRRRLRECWRYRLKPADAVDEHDFLDELDRRLERAVSRRLPPGTGLALSSGLDSRTLAALVRRRAPDTLAVTYGAPGSEDLTGGAELADRGGLPHRAITLEPGYIARGAAETVWLAEGHVRCFHAHHLVLRSLREENGLSALLMGFGGDIVMRGRRPRELNGSLAEAIYDLTAACVTDALVPVLFEDRFAAEVAGRARKRLVDLVEAETGSALVRVQQFGFRSNRRQMLWGTELFRDDLVARDPFHDLDVVDHCRDIPEELRIGGNLHRAYLRRNPQLASVLNPKDGLPAHLVGRRRQAAAAALRVRRGALKALQGVRGRPFVARDAGLGDYSVDLRGESRRLLDILLEPRTLARGQLREEGVRRLVDRTLAGRVGDTRALGMLLTFELFQRQFLEGEPPT
jgi:asparagine synthetase B (glutamine-hydrolysing)